MHNKVKIFCLPMIICGENLLFLHDYLRRAFGRLQDFALEENVIFAHRKAMLVTRERSFFAVMFSNSSWRVVEKIE